jgi:dTDP-4-dehydrorhamnose reductase
VTKEGKNARKAKAPLSNYALTGKRPKDSSLNITKCLNTLMKAKPLKLSEALKAMKLERQQQNRLEE